MHEIRSFFPETYKEFSLISLGAFRGVSSYPSISFFLSPQKKMCKFIVASQKQSLNTRLKGSESTKRSPATRKHDTHREHFVFSPTPLHVKEGGAGG